MGSTAAVTDVTKQAKEVKIPACLALRLDEGWGNRRVGSIQRQQHPTVTFVMYYSVSS